MTFQPILDRGLVFLEPMPRTLPLFFPLQPSHPPQIMRIPSSSFKPCCCSYVGGLPWSPLVWEMLGSTFGQHLISASVTDHTVFPNCIKLDSPRPSPAQSDESPPAGPWISSSLVGRPAHVLSKQEECPSSPARASSWALGCQLCPSRTSLLSPLQSEPPPLLPRTVAAPPLVQGGHPPSVPIASMRQPNPVSNGHCARNSARGLCCSLRGPTDLAASSLPTAPLCPTSGHSSRLRRFLRQAWVPLQGLSVCLFLCLQCSVPHFHPPFIPTHPSILSVRAHPEPHGWTPINACCISQSWIPIHGSSCYGFFSPFQPTQSSTLDPARWAVPTSLTALPQLPPWWLAQRRFAA